MNTQLTVEYWGVLADRRGTKQELIATQSADVKQLFDELFIGQDDALITVIKPVINDEFVPWHQALAEGDRVAFLPPMSGG